jgi:3-methylfumaryl-CoA hydratase
MWAGGRLQWHVPLHIGDEVQRTSRIVSITHKAGRSGDLVFVVVRHELRCSGELALSEEQDIVYRAPARPGDPAPAAQPAPTEAAWSCDVVPDPVLLFRYSALTFNSHRIHYDRPYATEVEGYQGLVVHGPLIATLLADLARRERPQTRVTAFSFKAVRPTTDLHAFRVCGAPAVDGSRARLWAQDHEGCLTMQAEIVFA